MGAMLMWSQALARDIDTRSSNQTMKLTATATRFGESFLVTNSLPLRFTLCVGGRSLSYSR